MNLYQSFRVGSAVIAAIVFLAGLNGCSYPVRVVDHNAPAYSAAIAVKPESWQYSRRHHQGGIEVAYERYRGSGDDLLPADEYIAVSPGVLIIGPESLRNSATANHGHIAYRLALNLGKHFELEPAVGITFDQLKVRIEPVDAAKPVLAKNEGSLGVMIAITPRWRFNEYFAVGYQFRGSLGDNQTWVSYSGFEVTADPFERLQLKAGYYSREESRGGLIDDNIEVSFDGFNAGLTFVFK